MPYNSKAPSINVENLRRMNKNQKKKKEKKQKDMDVDLPYRGKVHDIGPAVSHKAEIVELMVRGYATPVVAHKMNRSIASCDRYYKDYKRVIKLEKSYTLTEISTRTGMSESLIKEYIMLAEKLDYRFRCDNMINIYEMIDWRDILPRCNFLTLKSFTFISVLMVILKPLQS